MTSTIKNAAAINRIIINKETGEEFESVQFQKSDRYDRAMFIDELAEKYAKKVWHDANTQYQPTPAELSSFKKPLRQNFIWLENGVEIPVTDDDFARYDRTVSGKYGKH